MDEYTIVTLVFYAVLTTVFVVAIALTLWFVIRYLRRCRHRDLRDAVCNPSQVREPLSHTQREALTDLCRQLSAYHHP